MTILHEMRTHIVGMSQEGRQGVKIACTLVLLKELLSN